MNFWLNVWWEEIVLAVLFCLALWQCLKYRKLYLAETLEEKRRENEKALASIKDKIKKANT